MFRFIRSLFSNDLLIELSENKITVKVFASDEKYEDEPYIAIENTNKGGEVKAIGKVAKQKMGSDIVISNPFRHPRSFIADFFLAEKVIQHGVYEIHKSRIRPAPRIIMHQLEKTEGGLTDIEDRVLRELAVGAGAREVVIYLGSKINTNVDSFNSIKSRESSRNLGLRNPRTL